MKKSVFYSLLAVFIGVFVFSAYKLGSYWMEKVRSDELLNEASLFVSVVETPEVEQGGGITGDVTDPEKIEVDFEELWAMNRDVVAWIYCPNTKINYPIVQTDDNDYYLNHLLDGTWNGNGSIFMDYENGPDFSDGNTLIYGHRMKTGAMFGEVSNYRYQSFYDEHPYLYIITPTQRYRVDLFAACVVSSVGKIYSLQPSEDVIRDCISRSSFSSSIDYPSGNIVTLSTCTAEAEDKRFVVLGELVPIDN